MTLRLASVRTRSTHTHIAPSIHPPTCSPSWPPASLSDILLRVSAHAAQMDCEVVGDGLAVSELVARDPTAAALILLDSNMARRDHPRRTACRCLARSHHRPLPLFQPGRRSLRRE